MRTHQALGEAPRAKVGRRLAGEAIIAEDYMDSRSGQVGRSGFESWGERGIHALTGMTVTAPGLPS